MIDISASTKQLLNQVLGWLEREQQECGEGFFCKSKMLVQAHEAGELYCGLAGGSAVGFVMHSIVSARASIDILEVHPERRRQRIGTQLALNAIERLRSAGAETVGVQCSPRSSEPFWRSLGFLPPAVSHARAHEPVRLVLGNVA
ncbi:GNAT family N-acetyltransferase [Rhodanobacter glycinis]|uniref:GNAT family N-acetyltransferase n=1 Tax=Rhodanobacter glycinis TaxID=582702 RepID=UPI000B87F1B4|nr:GNAT family N-acetyltransferase [Rhodanobacter glycinis]